MVKDSRIMDLFEVANYQGIVHLVDYGQGKNDIDGWDLGAKETMAIAHSFFECQKFSESIRFGKKYLKNVSLVRTSRERDDELDLVLLDMALSYEYLNKSLLQYFYLSKYLSLGKPNLKITNLFRMLERSLINKVKGALTTIVLSFFAVTFFAKPTYKDTGYYTLFVVTFFLLLVLNYFNEEKINSVIRKLLKYLSSFFFRWAFH